MEDDKSELQSGSEILYIRKIPTLRTWSSKWMLVYERDGELIKLPPTEQDYAIISNIAATIVNRSGLNVVAHVTDVDS